LLAIIRALEQWHIFLEGTKEPITIYTDHRNLEYWKTARTFNRQHAQWYQIIASYNFHIVYQPGKLSSKPDILSRRSEHDDIPNKEEVMIKDETFKGFAAQINESTLDRIKEGQKE